MWRYQRLFSSVLICGLLLGSVFFIRLQVSENNRRPAPDFLPNVSRFRASRVCSQRALVLVNSAPKHANRRQIIRETWAHPTVTNSLDVSVGFGVGAAGEVDTQRSLDWEAEIYGDIFQVPGVDTGAPSVSKAIQLLKAARGACSPMPEFILKTEEDVFVNPFALAELLEILETFSSSNILWCLEWQRQFDRPRNNATWIVQLTQFNESVHPSYCLSTVYLMTGRTLEAIIRRHEIRTDRVMLPEDVYITGMLTKEAGIVHSTLGERVVFDSKNERDVDVGKIAFAYLGEEVDDGTGKLWRALVNRKMEIMRRSDTAL